MKIRFLGQSGYVLRTEKTQLIIDPYLSDSVNRVAGRPRALPIPILPRDICCDAVVCTHDHLDHLDPDTVAQIPKGQLFITTTEGKSHLESLGQTNATALLVGDSITVGDMVITAVFADHTVEAFGLIVEGEGKTLYFSGDTLFEGSCGRTDLPGGDWAVILKSLKRLKEMDRDYKVYPGHGPATTLAEEQMYNPYMRG